MKSLILILFLMLGATQVSAQYYDYSPYQTYGYPPPVNRSSQGTPQYVQTIENNGPQVDMRRNMERMNRQIEYNNMIRNYELIYGDRNRRQ